MIKKLISFSAAAAFICGESLAQTSDQSAPTGDSAIRVDRAAPKAPPPGARRPPQPQGWSFAVGVAPIFGPIYEGADDYGFSVFPDFRVSYGTSFFASVPEGIGYRVVNTRNWRAGPIARLRFGRDEDSGGSPFLLTGDTDDLVGLGDVGVAVELGGFAEVGSGRWRARRNPPRRWRP